MAGRETPGNKLKDIKKALKSDEGSAGITGAARAMTVDIFRDDYTRHFDQIRRASSYPRHFFPLNGVSDAAANLDMMAANNMGTFYDSASAGYRFRDIHRETMERGMKLVAAGTPDEDTMAQHAHALLRLGYDQVTQVKRLERAKAKFIGTERLSGPVRFQAMRLMDEIGTEKPPEYTELLRKYIPRWMSLGIPYPAPERETVPNPWGEFTERDVDFLISPQQVAEGRAPIHRVLQIGDELKATGFQDSSYHFRTYGILHTLQTEHELAGVEMGELAELPLFTYIVGGLLVDKREPAPRGAHFDYATAIDETMRDTFSRVVTEMQRGEVGLSTTFLNILRHYYGDTYPNLAALAIVKYDQGGNGVDMLPLIRELTTTDQPWASGVREAIDYISPRRVLTSGEVESHAAALPAKEAEDEDTSAQVIANASTIIGDRDVIGFSTQVNKMYPGMEAPRVDLDLELDRTSEAVKGRVRIERDGVVRYIPLAMSFTGEPESFQFPVLDDIEISAAAVRNYRGIVIDALTQQAGIIEKAGRKPEKFDKAEFAAETPEPLVFVNRSRAERLASYAEEKARAARKRRRPAEATELVEGEAARVPQLEDLQLSQIQGFEYEAVRAVFDEQEISGVNPDSFMERLNYMAAKAEANRKRFGNRLNLASFKGDASGVDLRQIRWAVPRSNTTILAYVEQREGEYIFRGATEQRGKRQRNYVTDIVNNILAEQAAA